MTEKILCGINPQKQSVIFGSFDSNTRIIESEFDVVIQSKTDGIKISGNEKSVNLASEVIENLINLDDKNEELTEQNVRYVISMVSGGNTDELKDFSGDCICITSKGKPVMAKTYGQKNYINAIKDNTVTLGIGPAGTGKTFLAVAMAVTALRTKQVSRIILTRPAVEAGERLGFLPGDLQSKIDPYLRPLYDALYELMGAESFARNMERGVIEIAPLAYMRGRTLDDSFIILDEAQNTTPEQMKMFLTRLGFGSKIVVTGDITQIDLPGNTKSGLEIAAKIIENIPGISVFHLSDKDIVRHSLVQKIINAYEKFENRKRVSSDNRETTTDSEKSENNGGNEN